MADRRRHLLDRPLSLPSLERADLLCLAVLAAVTFLALPVSLWRGQTLFERDIQFMWYAQTEAFVRSVAAGAWPVWNPLAGFGKPLWADANSQVLYPPTWLHLVLRPWTYYRLFVIVHLFLAGAGVFALARRLALSRLAALAGGCLWIASGPLLSTVNLWNQLAGAAWMPWAMVAADRALREGRRRDVLAWGSIQGAQILAGSPEMAVMTGLAIAVYAAGLLAWSARDRRERLSILGRAGLALAFAAGLSAAQWIPSGEVAVRAGRGHLPRAVREYWSVHPLTLIQVLLPPRLDQLPLSDDQRARLFEAREPLLASLYLGLPAVGLIGAALLGPGRRVRWMALGLGVVAALAALGRYTPVFGILGATIPLVSSLRFPAKAMVGVALGGALLSAFGVEAWRRREGTSRAGRWLAAVVAPLLVATGAALAAAAVTRQHPDAWAGLLAQPTSESYAELVRPIGHALTRTGALTLVALLAATLSLRGRTRGTLPAMVVGGACLLDLLANHHALNRTAPRELFTFRPPTLEALGAPDGSRLYVYDYFGPWRSRARLGRLYPFLPARLPVGWPTEAAAAFAMHVYLFPPSGALWGFPGSYDPETAWVTSEPLVELGDALRDLEGTPGHLKLLQVGAVGHVIALHPGFPALQPLAEVAGWLPEPIRIWRVPDPVSRAYAVSGVRIADGAEAIHTLEEPAFDPRQEVVLPAGEPRAPVTSFQGQVRVVDAGPERMRLEAVLSAPGHVVMVDAYDPGWKATVDGRPAAVLRANVGFRAVAVPAGAHRIECRYAPGSIALGSAVTLITLLGAAVLAATRGRTSSAMLPPLDTDGR